MPPSFATLVPRLSLGAATLRAALLRGGGEGGSAPRPAPEAQLRRRRHSQAQPGNEGDEGEYADGTRLFAENRHTHGCWSAISEHAHGTKGSADLTSDRGLFVIKGKDGNVWRYPGAKQDPYQLEHNNFYEAIHKDLPYNEAERGALSTMTCIMGRMAAYSGQQIEWEDALRSEKTLAPLIESWEAEPPVKPRADGLYNLPVPGKSDPV